MAQKIYYDAVNNKQVVDVSGVKDEATVKAEHGLDPSVQVLEIDESFEATEVIGGNLQKFDNVARLAAAATAAAAQKAGKRTAMLAKLGPGWTEADLDTLGEAIA